MASEVRVLLWPAFDPFPAFVASLHISNVIQILLMPLIMVGQNLTVAMPKRALNSILKSIRTNSFAENEVLWPGFE